MSPCWTQAPEATIERAGGFISAACIRDWAARIRGTVGAMQADSTAMCGQRSGLQKERLDGAGRGLEATTRVAKPTE
jgi:hypothetical protein